MVTVKPLRALTAVICAAIVCALGIWLFMGNVHDNSAVIRAVLRWAFPTVSLASLGGFFGSNIVYWASLALAFGLWVVVLYLILSWFDRRYRRA